MPSGVYVDVAYAARTDTMNTFAHRQIIDFSLFDANTDDTELINNNSFANGLIGWTDDGSGFSVTDGNLSHTGAQGKITQSVTIPANGLYLVEIKISGWSTGWADSYDDQGIDVYAEGNGVFRGFYYLTSGTDNLYLEVSADWDGQAEYVSLKHITDDFLPAQLTIRDQAGDFPNLEFSAYVVDQVFIGLNAGNQSIYQNIGIGSEALSTAPLAVRVVAVGNQAGVFSSGYDCLLFGPRAGYANTGNDVTAIGSDAGFNNSGNNGIYIGKNAGNGESVDNRLHIGANGDIISGTMNAGDAATQSLKFHAATIDFSDLPDSPGATGTLWVDQANGGVIKRA